MAALTITSGSRIIAQLPGFLVEFVQVTTTAAGETGGTFESRLGKITEVFATGNEDTKGGAFTASWSGSTVTLKSVAGATGDAVLVSLMIVGF